VLLLPGRAPSSRPELLELCRPAQRGWRPTALGREVTMPWHCPGQATASAAATAALLHPKTAPHETLSKLESLYHRAEGNHCCRLCLQLGTHLPAPISPGQEPALPEGFWDGAWRHSPANCQQAEARGCSWSGQHGHPPRHPCSRGFGGEIHRELAAGRRDRSFEHVSRCFP